jgi:hypothetical protein
MAMATVLAMFSTRVTRPRQLACCSIVFVVKAVFQRDGVFTGA